MNLFESTRIRRSGMLLGHNLATATVPQGHRPTFPADQAKTPPLVAIAAKDEARAGRNLGVGGTKDLGCS